MSYRTIRGEVGITEVSVGKGTALLVCGTFFLNILLSIKNTLNFICIIFGCNQLKTNKIVSLFRIVLSPPVLKALCR